MRPVVLCPACRALVVAGADLCPTCHADLWAPAPPDPALDAIVARMKELVATADAPSPAVTPPSRWSGARRVLVWGALAATVIFAAAAVYGWRASGHGHQTLAMAGTFGAIFFFLLLVALVNRRPLWRPPAWRGTGEIAARAYVEAVLFKQWDAAFDTLSPIARARPATVPGIPALGSSQENVPLAGPNDVRTYWDRLIPYGFAESLILGGVEVVPRSAAGDVEAHRVTLDVRPLRALNEAARKVPTIALSLAEAPNRIPLIRLTYDCVVLRHHSQYWVLTGEVCSPIDRELSRRLRPR